MRKLKVLSLFSGIGAFEEALDNTNREYELINYCEFEDYISKAYSLIRNVSKDLNLGDITKVDEKNLENFDLMTYGFPCQDISALGNQMGLYNEDGNLTRSGLFFEAMRIAKYKRPKYMIAENVRALVSNPMKDNYDSMIKLLDGLGYNTYVKVLNSKDFKIPHSRNRVFMVSIRKDVDNEIGFQFPNKKELTIKASDLYDIGNISNEFYLEENHYKYFSDFRLKKKYSSLNSDILVCMTTKQGQKSNPQNFIKDSKGYRILTDGEYFAFQGFKKKYGKLLRDNGFTTSQIGYMCGNSITVTVLENIFDELYRQYIDNDKE